MDYGAKKQNQYIHQCFKTPSNPLEIYAERSQDGVIILSDIMPTTVDMSVYDFDQNQSSLRFQIMRNESFDRLNVNIPEHSLRLTPTDSIVYHHNNFTIYFPKGSVDRPQYIDIVTQSKDSVKISSKEEYIAFFQYFKISQNSISKSDCPKCVYTSINQKGELVSYGSKWENDSTLISYVNDLGTFYIMTDTIAPRIQNLELPNSKSSILKFNIIDNFVPNYRKDYIKYEVLVDNQWTLCQEDIKSNRVWCDTKSSKSEVSPHEIIIKLKDSADNLNVVKKTFYR